ncbi:exportin-2-like [Styela clava]|uniref:exportin-2-like n=1 Tax=Styela clava TaxID=7725 RepID=UPI00193A6F7B|nr:exportin-2-like [Styela clava]
MSEQDLQALSGYLEQTLSPEAGIRKQAEKFLESVEGNSGYALMLLKLVEAVIGQQTKNAVIPLASAVTFKNFVKRNWRKIPDEPSKISEADRNTIKQHVVDLMLRSPEQYQKQLSEAISIIGREDFPHEWPTLMQEMITKFQSGDFHIINGVLQTAHSLFKRYRHEFRSDKLWTEIKIVLDAFAAPLTELFLNTVKLLEQHAANKDAAKVLFSSLVLISKIFYSLNYQDLPEFFEDNMDKWMPQFHMLLTTDNKLLHTGDDEEAGYVELLKSQICDNVALYAQKYDEEFTKFLPQFVTAIWELLVNTGMQVKYDLLTSNAIGFLTSVSEKQQYKSLFEADGVLASICEKVVVPNMEFRTADEEQFEDNPEEYIRRDLEGSDVHTRRRASCDLVRGLTKHFEAPVTQIFSQYVATMLELHAKDRANNWKSKDAAIYLVTSLAQKGSTSKHGTTKASELVNLQDFFDSHILTELASANISEFPVLKSDSIKYIVTFRQQMGKERLMKALPLLVQHLPSTSIVVHTYAAHAIERFLTIKAQGNVPLISKTEIQPLLENLLANLFQALRIPGSTENEYVMKAAMRTFSLAGELVCPYIPTIVNELCQKLLQSSKNPSKPHFNHYLFEALSICIKVSCQQDKSAVASFEQALFEMFTDILQRDVTEFIPYVFQIMSMLLEIREPPIPETYMALFPHLLNPDLWDRPGNIPPLVRLLQAYIEKGPDSIAASGKLSPLLGVFQKMIASKTNDHQGFYLLNSMYEYIKPEALEQYTKQIFSLLFQRLMKSKTVKFTRGLIVYFCLYMIKLSPDAFQKVIDSIQPNMFAMVLEKLLIADVQKVSGTTEKKICSVGLSKLLTECSAFQDENYARLWPPLLQAVIGLFELPEDDSVPDDEHFIEVEETPGYQTAYSQLAFASKKSEDPVKVDNPKVYLAQCLASFSKNCPGKVPNMVNYLNPDAKTFLQQYMAAANVQIS